MWFAHIVLKLRISFGIWDGLFLILYAAGRVQLFVVPEFFNAAAERWSFLILLSKHLP
jgi:hypothetical protein